MSSFACIKKPGVSYDYSGYAELSGWDIIDYIGSLV